MRPPAKPRVAFVGTGGTLASVGRGPLDLHDYGATGRVLDGYYFGLDATAAPPHNGRRTAFLPYHRIPSPVLLEAFTLADHGSLLGFALGNDGDADPILAEDRDEASLAWGVLQQQRAIVDYADALLSAARLGGMDLNQLLRHLKEPALHGFRSFVRKPTLEEATAFGDLTHSDDQAHQGRTPIAGPLTTGEYLMLTLLGRRVAARRISYWPQASIRRFAATNPVLGSVAAGLGHCRAAAGTVRGILRRGKRLVLARGSVPQHGR